jgi:OOP family OmpA-OmpF porin
VKKTLIIGPELYGSTVVESGASAFGKHTTNLELLGGIHYRPSPWVIGIGAGPGLTTGPGTPDWRVVGTIGLAGWGKEEPPPKLVKDRDNDGIADEKDACPDVPGVANADPTKNGCPLEKPSDKDGDGIVDAEDACIDVPGVKDADPKKNGCPPDKDGDGIYDKDDACPDVAGMPDPDPKKNGCPPDKDADTIPDAQDACPDVPGVADPEPKPNGCPPDKDGDTILDKDDACPDVPGQANPDPAKNGCPLVVLTAKAIEINEQVHFEYNKANILPDSDTLLTAVAQVLKDHPEIKKISIEGHTDNKGAPAYNATLSQKRADAVMKWLVDHGIEKKRMSAKGFGQTKPIADNKTDEGREKNRRVEFKIVEKDESAAPPPAPAPAPAPTPKP